MKISTLTSPRKLIVALQNKGWLNWIPDKPYIKLVYWARMGQRLNLDNPETFNEKIQWLKLYDRKQIYTNMVDKYEAKKYAASIIGWEYIIPTINVWEKVEDIDFSELPDQFVLKCTHDSGGIVVCREKKTLDLEFAKEKLKKCLRRNFYLYGREWAYKDIAPRIIAEEYLEDSDTHELRDYKFFCFNGTVKIYKIDFNRFSGHRANYYDRNGELLSFDEVYCPRDEKAEIIAPKTIELMISLAEKLAKGLPFARVDFYDVNGKVYFGEITLYPSSGFGKFDPEEWDKIIGNWVLL